MKKVFIIFLLFCFSTQWMNSQTMAFSAIEVKVKPFTQKDIKEAFEEVFEDVEMNKGAIVLERFTGGDSNGMTHRLVFLYTLALLFVCIIIFCFGQIIFKTKPSQEFLDIGPT